MEQVECAQARTHMVSPLMHQFFDHSSASTLPIDSTNGAFDSARLALYACQKSAGSVRSLLSNKQISKFPGVTKMRQFRHFFGYNSAITYLICLANGLFDSAIRALYYYYYYEGFTTISKAQWWKINQYASQNNIVFSVLRKRLKLFNCLANSGSVFQIFTPIDENALLPCFELVLVTTNRKCPLRETEFTLVNISDKYTGTSQL